MPYAWTTLTRVYSLSRTKTNVTAVRPHSTPSIFGASPPIPTMTEADDTLPLMALTTCRLCPKGKQLKKRRRREREKNTHRHTCAHSYKGNRVSIRHWRRRPVSDSLSMASLERRRKEAGFPVRTSAQRRQQPDMYTAGKIAWCQRGEEETSNCVEGKRKKISVRAARAVMAKSMVRAIQPYEALPCHSRRGQSCNHARSRPSPCHRLGGEAGSGSTSRKKPGASSSRVLLRTPYSVVI